MLKTRTTELPRRRLPTPVPAIQLLYRSTARLGKPTVNVTSVLKPLLTIGIPQVVSYQSFYDSLNPVDEPSYAISGGLGLGGAVPQVESALFGPRCSPGGTPSSSPTPRVRAPISPPARVRDQHARRPQGGPRLVGDRPNVDDEDRDDRLLGRRDRHRVGRRAGADLRADVNSKLVGATMGGVLVDPAHNLHYVDGSLGSGRASCRWRSSASRAPSTSTSPPYLAPNTAGPSTRNSKRRRSPKSWRSTPA